MINFLKETIKIIEKSEHSINDIMFIGSDDGEYACTWSEFEKLADFEYDNGYGSEKINHNLIIEFNNNERLIRHEYDGAEWWYCIKNIPKLKNTKQINNLH